MDSGLARAQRSTPAPPPPPSGPAIARRPSSEGADDGGRRPYKLAPADLNSDAGPAYVKASPGSRVNLNFTEVELDELTRSIALATGKRFIIPAKVRSLKSSIFSPTPVSSAEAYQAYLSVLAANGMTVVPSGRFLKLVESDTAPSQPLAMCVDGESCPAGDRMITRLHKLNFVSVADMVQVMERFGTGDSAIVAYAPTNTMIVTDYSSNIRRMLRIVQELDVQGVGTQVWVEPVHFASASEAAEVISALFETEAPQRSEKTSSQAQVRSKAKRGKQQATRQGASTIGSGPSNELSMIIPDERTNQLIIVASHGAYLRIIELLQRIDVQVGGGNGQIRVHKLENATAEALATTLSNLTAKTSTKRGRSKSKAPVKEAASLFEGEVQVTADIETNALVITGSDRDYASLKQVIDELDVERRQVFVEAMIMEVSILGKREGGVSFHGGREDEMTIDGETKSVPSFGGTLFPVGTSGTMSSAKIDPSILQGLALGLQGPALESSVLGMSIPSFGVVVQAYQTSSDVNILSTPHILAMDNTTAKIQVGSSVPVSTSIGSSSAFSSLLSSATSEDSSDRDIPSSFFPTYNISREDVGIEMEITPHINQSDQVRLEIQVQVSEIIEEGELGPDIGKRLAATTCVVDDSQTIVLGGLVTDTTTQGVSKVPILGDIPLLGRIFQRRTNRTTKRNLLIFMTPHIIRDQSDFRRIFTEKMRERQEFIDRFTAFDRSEDPIDIDYERTNGLLEEINRTVAQLDAEAEERRLLAPVEEPEHTPQPPLGATHDEPLEEPPPVIIEEASEPEEQEPVSVSASDSQGTGNSTNTDTGT